MHVRQLIVIAALGAAAIAGCGDDEDAASGATRAAATTTPTATPTPPPDPDSIETEKPGGEYIGRWSGAGVPGDKEFVLVLRKDGRYSTYIPWEDITLKGRYAAADGNRLVFTKDTGCTHGRFEGTGVYTWKVEGEKLVLENVIPETGGCTGRTETLTLPEWQRR